jgi:hypothetical protein
LTTGRLATGELVDRVDIEMCDAEMSNNKIDVTTTKAIVIEDLIDECIGFPLHLL